LRELALLLLLMCETAAAFNCLVKGADTSLF
jgi:hypothetical protein